MRRSDCLFLALICCVFTALPAGAVSVSAVLQNINAPQAKVAPAYRSPGNGAPQQIPGVLGFNLAFSSDNFILSNQRLRFSYVPYTNAPAWRLDMYTDNTNASPGLVQKGGLIGVSTNAAHVPLAWKQSPTELATLFPVDISTGSSGGWAWLKDKGDVDDPATPDMNESWATAFNGGYTAIAAGSLSNSDPATVYVYFEAKFKDAPADDYSTTVWLDLYQVLDDVAPTIYHNPVSTIVSRGNNLTLQATVTDDSIVNSCVFYYKLDDGPWYAYAAAASSGTQISKFYQFTLPPATIGNAAKISYAIKASDGYNYATFKSTTAPQVITIENEITFNAVTSGSLIVPDGNPNDGNTSLTIPSGAMSSPVNITISQLDPENAVDSPRRGIAFGAGDKPVAIYEFTPSGTHFSLPVEMTLLFLGDAGGKVYMPDGTVLTGVKKSDLRVFWWDGFVWRTVGGKLDDRLNTLTIKTDHFSKYAIFYQPAMSAADYRPKEKIITPNGDGKNDFAFFEGLEGLDYTITIFDVAGRKVKTLTADSLGKWDGTDESDRIVESGVYLYQFKADVNGSTKLVSGTIVVAK